MEKQNLNQNETASTSANEFSDQSDAQSDKQKRLSKTEKKFNRYQRKLANYKVIIFLKNFSLKFVFIF